MPTTSSATPQPSTAQPTHDDHPEPGSSFGSQSHTLVQSLIPSMTVTDKEVPKTGDETLPSTGGAVLRPPVPHGPKVSKFVICMRKIYRPLGFHKGYNFPLFIIFSGAMLGFSLAKLSNLNISGSSPSSGSFRSQAAPGEWYYLSHGIYRFGMTLHLATVLPAGILMVWQFVPCIRKRFYTFHRINGYVVIILIVSSNLGALMITRRAFGGGLDTQSAVGSLAVLSTVAIGMAMWNIWCLQIDQHRAWMLRAVFYMGTIITSRIIQFAAAAIISRSNDYYQVQTCGQVASNYEDPATIVTNYSQCLNSTVDLPVVVTANMHGSLEQVGASLGLGFGMALWMSILLHLVGVEIYLNLTPGETHRMRSISYERQLEAGFAHPGSAGITADRWGDAPTWQPVRTERPESAERTERTSSTVPMVEK